MKYNVYISWYCDTLEEYGLTDSMEYMVDDLEETLLELPEKIDYITRKCGRIITIQIGIQ